MTSKLLTTGCALIAFTPTLMPLFILAFHKAHLIIVVTTSAFAYLLSTLLSSLFYVVIPPQWSAARTHPIALLLPSVACQAWMRCAFVYMYHTVENVIQTSIRAHERQERRRQLQQQQQQQQQQRRRQSESTAVTNRTARTNATTSTTNNSGNNNSSSNNNNNLSESMQLRLELNDWSCGLAAGIGYGAMHAFMLYGTLLASEAGGMGTLYQSSCSFMPSIATSALNAFLFSILDMVCMLWVFYGMRRLQVEELLQREKELLMNSSSSSATTGGVMRRRGSYTTPGRGRLWVRTREAFDQFGRRCQRMVGLGSRSNHEEPSMAAGGSSSPTTPYTASENGSATHRGSINSSATRGGGSEYGMEEASPERRLLQPPRANGSTSAGPPISNNNNTSRTAAQMYAANDPVINSNHNNPPMSGLMAIVISTLSHLAAGFLTGLNVLENGCVLSLPLLAVVVFMTCIAFHFLIAPEYLVTVNGNGNGLQQLVNGNGAEDGRRQRQQQEEQQRASYVSGRSSMHEE